MKSPTRWSTIVLTAAITATLVAPTAVWATHQFVDVPGSHTFHDTIDWMLDNGITVGCNPPADDRYCPDEPVTRGQMSAFLKRIAENRVVDADKVDGLDGSRLAIGRAHGRVRVVGIIPGTSFWDMEFVGAHPGFLSARTPTGGVTCIKPDPAVLTLDDVFTGLLTDSSGNDTRGYFNGSFGCNADEVRVVQKFNTTDTLTNQQFNIFVP